MNYDLISELREIKEKIGLTNKEISDGSGVPISTVSRIFSSSNNCDVRYETLKPIARYLGELDDAPSEDSQAPQSDDSRVLALYQSIIEEKDALLADYAKRESRNMRILIILAIALAVLFTLFAVILTIDLMHPDRGWLQVVAQATVRSFGFIRDFL